MKHKKFWILILIGISIFFGIILISNIIEVGIRLRNVHPYLEYGFYGLSVILSYFLIINPIRVIVFAPTFKIDALITDHNHNHKLHKKAAKVLLNNDFLLVRDKDLLRKSMNDKVKLQAALKNIFETTLKSEIHENIEKNAKNVLITTALSQNGNLDMLSVLTINLKMIKEIVEISGFRPSYPYLVKLSINVLVTSLIAEGIEEIDLGELLPTKFNETLTEIPFIKTISGSIVGGISNAMLTCRVGIVTQKYLYNDNKLLNKKEIRKSAYKATLVMMPNIVKSGLYSFPKGVASFFASPFKKFKNKNKE
ncbi:MAG: YcjF family protein [Candidatus Izimaplasma sp.]|nr:YcjF family protein [Candidatus Izimaplasma bacterium]